jgi:uncharacterized membrane protein YphA (DoxX/SURF4 family)
MKILRLSARILIGLVFIFSGTVKAIDPLGSAYKFHDYFQAFNMGFLNELSLFLSVLLCTTEFIAGFSVLTGLWHKAGTWLAFLLMIIFTPLTLILAITNPVSDCGCFGDAIHLSNWQTFGKNIILLAAAIILIYGLKTGKHNSRPKSGPAAIAFAAGLFILFAFYNLRYLPLIDFLPYKTGVRIADGMTVPEGAPADVYKTSFIYEKDDIRKEFTLSDYPANDTSWKFVDQKSVLIKKGYTPPIHDFSIIRLDGEDLTQKILADTGYSVLMISKKLSEAGIKKLSEGFEFGRFCVGNGISYYVLTASGTDDAKKFDTGLNFCTADETTLKTMIRANPGYILLHNGIIIGKWSNAGMPGRDWFIEKTSLGIKR